MNDWNGTCPTWCNSHSYSAVAEDDFHRRDFDAPGDSVVFVSLATTAPETEPVLSWISEEHAPGSKQAREMAAALIAAADLVDSIHTKMQGAGK